MSSSLRKNVLPSPDITKRLHDYIMAGKWYKSPTCHKSDIWGSSSNDYSDRNPTKSKRPELLQFFFKNAKFTSLHTNKQYINKYLLLI